MLAQAAHLVDAVVPAVPLRHNGLSFPFELSLKVVTNPKVLRAPARINYEVTARYFQRRAAESSADGKTHVGAITFVHRFGSSLKLLPSPGSSDRRRGCDTAGAASNTRPRHIYDAP